MSSRRDYPFVEKIAFIPDSSDLGLFVWVSGQLLSALSPATLRPFESATDTNISASNAFGPQARRPLKVVRRFDRGLETGRDRGAGVACRGPSRRVCRAWCEEEPHPREASSRISAKEAYEPQDGSRRDVPVDDCKVRDSQRAGVRGSRRTMRGPRGHPRRPPSRRLALHARGVHRRKFRR